MVGVSRRQGDKLQRVQIKVDNSLYPYIETKPLHGSQKVLKQDHDSALIEIEVIVNRELKQLLLSYGCQLHVINPKSLSNEIEADLKKNLENYKYVHLD